ncbi:MAG: biosynthetic peptidoglycan transglycosylase [Candidatus Eisenbacteria bacterium]
MKPTPLRLALAAAALFVALGIAATLLAPRFAAARLHAAARARGVALTWRTLDWHWPAQVAIRDLAGRSLDTGDTLLAAGRLDVRLDPWPLLAGRPRIAGLTLTDARVRRPAGAQADADTLVATPDDRADAHAPVDPRVRAKAEQLVRLLLVPARRLPALHMERVTLATSERTLVLDAFDLSHPPAGTVLAAVGTLRGEDDVPFDLLAKWTPADRLTARAEFRIAGSERPSPDAVVVQFDGVVRQDRRAHELRIEDGARVRIGELGATLSARVAEAGPRFECAIRADSLTAPRMVRSLPQPVLGPLRHLEVRGSWDWHAGVTLDLSQPDSVRFTADVIPHGLWLDPALSRPSLHAIANPFTAEIHLPKQRIVTRELSPLNPHFRPLERISPYLRDALVTNEDGGFWKHRGFNTEAIGLAIAANLRAGSYRRGAGTITMQLARNLWLGHQRTLSRKAQEVVLAWLLEHQTGIPKERLIEIYLNVIEWGPDLHGADEAARWYFDRDAADLTLDEALFLAIVVPSPSKWRWRFDAHGELRPFARAQMHFIADKMAAKGWLDPLAVPAADSLRVTLRGPAAATFAVPDSAVAPTGTPADAPADSLANEPI